MNGAAKRVAAAVVAVAGVLVPRGLAQTAGTFDLPGGRADRAVVLFPGTDGPAGAPGASPGLSQMMLRLEGAAGVLRGPEELRRLQACVAPAEQGADRQSAAYPAEVPGTVRRWTLWLTRNGGKETKRVDILQTAAGELVAHEIDPTDRPTPLVELREDRLGELSAGWSVYAGAFEAGSVPEPKGVVFRVEPPLLVGRCSMDSATISDRLARGMGTTVKAADRTPAKETLHARLPTGYDPRRPAGLLVWVDAGPDGRPPEVFNAALDELGLIAIGAAASGNDRPVVERYQLALDAVATASTRWHVDPRRVYVTGISGGGRVSSILAACFPDVFTGAVPIVGLSVYTKVQLPAPAIGQFVRAGYERPGAGRFALFKQHRIAPMTGPLDMNYGEMTEATKILVRDGVPAKLFSYDDMGHQLPTAERFMEAIRWVDEPYQEMVRKEREQAGRLLDAYKAQYGGKPAAAGDATARKTLVKITEIAPWSDAAWEAAGMLGQSAKSEGGSRK